MCRTWSSTMKSAPDARPPRSAPCRRLRRHGPTRQAAVTDLQAGLELLIEELGPPDELTLTLDID
jgi:hypothetical protein